MMSRGLEGQGLDLLLCLRLNMSKTAQDSGLLSMELLTRSSAIAVIADRTACSILTLFIAIATSRPLNKKNPFPVSPWIQLRICVCNPQSTHDTLSLP